MRTILCALAVLTGCPSPANDCSSGKVVCGGPHHNDPIPQAAIPALVRAETVREETAIAGVQVTAVPASAAGWTIQISNPGDAAMSVIWDESSFVASNGTSYGRLIPADSRPIDIKTRPPAPLAPHAKVLEVVFPEKLLEDERFEAESARLETENGSRDELTKIVIERRATRARAIAGGKLYVAVVTPAGKQLWSGIVTEPAPPAAPAPAETK